MYEDRAVQPRQIYASTATRRDRRWTSRRRGRGLTGFAFVSVATILAALTVIASFAPGLT
jgi:hypothetical protein